MNRKPVQLDSEAHKLAKIYSAKHEVSIQDFLSGLIFEFNNKPASSKKLFFKQIIGQK